MKNKKILIIGPYPPPYGGVSVHVKRLETLLSNVYDIDVIDEGRIKKEKIYNIRSFNFFRYLSKVFSADIIHIHSGLFLFRLFHFLTASFFFKKKIITIHGYEPGRGKKVRSLDRMILNRCSKVIFVSNELAEAFKVKGYIIKEAFLPPDINDEKEIPAEVTDWIEKKKLQDYTICVANAWRLDSHNDEDLYGLDLSIWAAKRLKADKIKAAIIFVVGNDTGVIKIKPYKQMINDAGLKDCFLLLEAPLSFVKLIMRSDIVLRPTNTDGDALTVREGLFLGKTVIASDVVLRPQNTKLFKNRDANSLALVIADVKNSKEKNPEVRFGTADDLSSYTEYYRNFVYKL